MPLPVAVQRNTIRIGDHFSFRFHRTLRVPDNDRTHALPANLGTFEVCRVDDYPERVPKEWLEHGGVFICMWPHEAMWISLSGELDAPVAVKLAAGKVCAITGKPWAAGLEGGAEQNYMLVPGQLWIDGFKCRDGRVRQFVGSQLGQGETVEAQVTGKEDVGGFQLQIFESRQDHRPAPSAGRATQNTLADEPLFAGGLKLHTLVPRRPERHGGILRFHNVGQMAGTPTVCSVGPVSAGAFMAATPEQVKGAEMGLAAGGLIEQAILKAGSYQPAAFDLAQTGRVFIHIVDANLFHAITGRPAHPSPISEATYKAKGYPWFSTWALDAGNDVAVKEPLAKIKSVGQIEKEKKTATQQGLIDADCGTVIPLGGKIVKDGNW